MMLKRLPPAILDSHVAWLGKTGTGKSGGIRAAVIEPMLDAGHRICCIDPTDTQWGIRLTPDGKKSKYGVIIFGGRHGDRPLGPHDGEAIAEAVGTSNSSVIISTKLMRPIERTKFFTDFAETLLRVNQGLLHLIIDEAHLFAPQAGGMGMGKEATAMLHATNDLVSLGRGAGLCIILATQRSAKLHKDSASQCETLVAMRMSHPLDQAAVEDWIGISRIKKMKKPPADYLERAEEIMGGIAFLADRSAYVWAPDPKINVFNKIEFQTYKTFDSGERNVRGAAMKLTPIDMSALEGKLKQVAEEKEANDPEKLKVTIAQLQRQLAVPVEPIVAENTTPAALKKVTDAADKSGFDRAKSEAAAAAHRLIESAVAEIEKDIEPFNESVKTAVHHLRKVIGERLSTLVRQRQALKPVYAPPPPPPQQPRQLVNQKPVSIQPSHAGRSAPAGAMELQGPERRILDSLSTWRLIGHDAPNNAQVAWLAGYSPSSSSFTNARSAVKTKGLITYPNPDRITLTVDGAAASIPTQINGSLLDHILARLPGPERRILDSVARSYPHPITNENAATGARYSPTSSSYTNARSALKTKDLISYPSDGMVLAASWILLPVPR